MKRVCIGMMVLAMILPAAAFAGGRSETRERLVVYSSVDEENAKKILDAFTADTGIEVSFVHLSTGPALARMTAEASNPQADVWMGAPNENHITAKERGLTVSYTSEVTLALDPVFRDPDGYWTSFYMNPMGVGVNTSALAREGLGMPSSWQDLLDPQYRRQIQMPSPATSGTAYNVITSLTMEWGEEKTFEYLKALSPNIQTYTSSGTAPAAAVAVGEAPVGLQFTPAFFQAADEGFPVEVIFPSEGVGFEAPAVSILKGSRNIEAAQKLVDWLVSVDGQNVLTRERTYFYPVNPAAELGPGMPSFDSLRTISVDPEWAGAERQRLVERWEDEVLPLN
ncbi:ABC transporter substrate-binding protein [Alkalispirochaeta sphaeroplastigenens]|uniref:ABC transporter substrate-binding protein n=1 Tax=Alkalispirochaeta sphaeroplastigenens TaxID=1187066 RepID=A0A2S4JWZ5_9SPIO|nr:ABC transporter substrate-binding protein [Alkalispirochaeta sphaeroplastigenens]POR04020.1 ABC transporter substrate-binding protein [Alkalispirochaeta sphaeroplastigenens]